MQADKNQSLLLSADAYGTLAVWNMSTSLQPPICTLQTHQRIHAMKVHPNANSTVVVGQEDGVLSLYSIL